MKDKETAKVLAFNALIAFAHYAHQGYTLRPDGWYKGGLYRFSRADGVRAILAGKVPF